MNVGSVDKAKAALDRLPLVAANVATFELLPVSRFCRWAFCSHQGKDYESRQFTISELLAFSSGEGPVSRLFRAAAARRVSAAELNAATSSAGVLVDWPSSRRAWAPAGMTIAARELGCAVTCGRQRPKQISAEPGLVGQVGHRGHLG
jgi:hypothetical protein